MVNDKKDIQVNEAGELQRKFQVLSELQGTLANRLGLSKFMGVQYQGDRNLYDALGYCQTPVFDDYYAKYIRQDISSAIIDKPVDKTWQGDVFLLENQDKENTLFEQAWIDLLKDYSIGLKNKIVRADRLTGIGRYGVLLLGLDDVQTIEDFNKPVTPGKRKLVYLSAYSERSATIATYEQSPTNSRFGLPKTYQINNTADGISNTFTVHYTRVVHIVDHALDCDYLGTPRLENILNRLFDLEKLTGGGAEMFWRGARPGYAAELDKEMSLTPTAKEDLHKQLDEWEHNLRRVLTLKGVKMNGLDVQVSDPSPHVDIQLQMISAAKNIPKRILVGSERGELASTQDQDEWLSYIQFRREEFAEAQILRPLIAKLIEYQILPKPKEDYTIVWDDLFSVSDQSKSEIAKLKAEALKAYASEPMAQSIIPQHLFLKLIMSLKEDDIEQIMGSIEDQQTQEENSLLTQEEEQLIKSQQRVKE